MRPRFLSLTALILTAAITLSACESSEERAQRHYETGLELLEEGDVDRALVEFRNVFKLNPRHKEARMVYARTQKEQGKRSEAYGQFLRVVEQYPETVDARIELAEMALDGRNWDEATRHGEAAVKLAPDEPRVRVIATALEYFEAYRADDRVLRDAAAEKAASLLEEMPENFVARRIVIDQLLGTGNHDKALPVINEGIKQRPNEFELHRIRLGLQSKSGDDEAVGTSLKQMVEIFPGDEETRRLLILWYIQRGDVGGAEEFLRGLAAKPDANESMHMSVVQFILRSRGEDAAREELGRLIKERPDPTTYQVLLASLDFDSGKQDKAIADLETLVDSSEESTEQIDNGKITLARMLLTTGNPVGARARVEEVIASDSSHVEALKLRAGWRIEDDQPGDAVVDLRTALSQSPRDPTIMTLMGMAHERAGDRELAGERYALAVEQSGRAPEESLRYASFLIRENRVESAEAVLTEALNEAPRHVELIQLTGALHLKNRDWNEARRSVWKLRAIETAEAAAVANGLEAEILLQQNRVDDTVAFLKELAQEDDSMGALTALVQTQVRTGQIAEAKELVEQKLTKKPDDPALRFMHAGLLVVDDQRDQAETIYRDLLTEMPGNDSVIRTLHTLLIADGRTDDAAELIDAQIKLSPTAINVRLLKAEKLELARDFEGAIAIYDGLYQENSNNLVIANNLASLISTHRDDGEGLQRAYAVARRLRGLEVPAFQDTYGWIEYRRGNYEEALAHLEPAAKGLAADPLVQYHLGRTYLALERFPEARATLEQAISLSGDSPLPQIETARELLATIPGADAGDGQTDAQQE